MWLLDANMDVHLTGVLNEYGIRCEAATRRGWGGLTNGDLVEAATKAGFTCILTRDRLFADSVGRMLDEHANFSIVVVHLPQKPWRDYVEEFRSVWTKEPIAPIPGRVIHWPRPPAGFGAC